MSPDNVRSLVRPVVTVILVGAFVAAALMGNGPAVKWLTPFTGMAIAWWFAERSQKRAVERAMQLQNGGGGHAGRLTLTDSDSIHPSDFGSSGS